MNQKYNENSSYCHEKIQAPFWYIEYSLVFIPITTVLGNILVISSITFDVLMRTSPTNWFIISLALADIGGLHNVYYNSRKQLKLI